MERPNLRFKPASGRIVNSFTNTPIAVPFGGRALASAGSAFVNLKPKQWLHVINVTGVIGAVAATDVPNLLAPDRMTLQLGAGVTGGSSLVAMLGEMINFVPQAASSSGPAPSFQIQQADLIGIHADDLYFSWSDYVAIASLGMDYQLVFSAEVRCWDGATNRNCFARINTLYEILEQVDT